jgi:hypothetical protein
LKLHKVISKVEIDQAAYSIIIIKYQQAFMPQVFLRFLRKTNIYTCKK